MLPLIFNFPDMKAMAGFSLPKKKIQNQQERKRRQNMQTKSLYPKVVFGGYFATQLLQKQHTFRKNRWGMCGKEV